MLVGVLGFIGSGKGTVGDILSADYGFQKASFAEHVKNVTSVMFGWSRDLLEGDTEESRKFREVPDSFWTGKFGKEFTPRLALQLMGTEVGRQVFHENFWVHALDNKLKGSTDNFVITDVRFKNEIDYVQNNGGILIEVRRGITPHWYDIAAQANTGHSSAERFMVERLGIHESEWRWVGCHKDHVVYNDGTLDELKIRLKKCLTDSYGSSIIDDLQQGV